MWKLISINLINVSKGERQQKSFEKGKKEKKERKMHQMLFKFIDVTVSSIKYTWLIDFYKVT